MAGIKAFVRKAAKFVQMLKTLTTARGLEILLVGKEAVTSGSISLGTVIAIKKELSQDKIWMVIENSGQESLIPIEQIAAVSQKIILLDGASVPTQVGVGCR